MTGKVDTLREKYLARCSYHASAFTDKGLSEWAEESGEDLVGGSTYPHTRGKSDVQPRTIIYIKPSEGVTEYVGQELLKVDEVGMLLKHQLLSSSLRSTSQQVPSFQPQLVPAGIYSTLKFVPEKDLFPASAWPRWISHAARGVLLTASNPAVRERVRPIVSRLRDLARSLPESIVEESELWADESPEGSVHLEWLFANVRVGFTVEPQVDETHWYVVSRTDDGPSLQHGLISKSEWPDILPILQPLLSELS